jgi:hypothetical protein
VEIFLNRIAFVFVDKLANLATGTFSVRIVMQSSAGCTNLPQKTIKGRSKDSVESSVVDPGSGVFYPLEPESGAGIRIRVEFCPDPGYGTFFC